MNNYKKENHTASVFRKRLAAACEGLNYISETDAPFEPVFGGKAGQITAEFLGKEFDIDVGVQKEEMEFAQFFERLTRKQDWHGEAEKKTAQKFEKLEKLLKVNLRDLKVFRFGRVRIDIYTVGIDADGNLAGVKTKAVET